MSEQDHFARMDQDVWGGDNADLATDLEGQADMLTKLLAPLFDDIRNAIEESASLQRRTAIEMTQVLGQITTLLQGLQPPQQMPPPTEPGSPAA